MPDAQDHLDPKEATEARLCAYLEGELPPQERAEIEAHLKANPQHRQLLIDLAQTRDWVRLIPQESAPSDLAEAIAAHLERSMLLDEHRESGVSTINQLPQYAMLAAIVILALGLGALIFVVLHEGRNYTIAPPGTSTGGTAAVSKLATTSPVPGELASGKGTTADTVPRITDTSTVAMAPAASAEMKTAHPTRSLGNDGVGQAAAITKSTSLLNDQQSDTAAVAKLKTELASGGFHIPSERRTICLVVSTPAPSTTADQVRRFFTTNQLVFAADQLYKTESAGLNQFAAAMPMAANASTMNNPGGGAQNLQAQQVLPQQTSGSTALGQQQTAPGVITPAVPSTQSSTTLPTTMPADEMIYVGRGLTPLQLELLHGTLATSGIDQTVKRLDLSQPATTQKALIPTTMKDAVTISRGQTLTVTVPQLVGPGIEKTNVVKVADDGTISLPMLDPLPAASASPAELQDRIVGKYREANLIPAATVTVAVNAPATQPATQPAPVVATARPATMPAASQPAPIINATTQPADDGKLDVVVYVRQAK